MTPRETYYALTAYKIIQAMSKRNIRGFYCETRQDALKKAMSLVADGSKVSWGGSQTLEEIGLITALRQEAEPRRLTLADRTAAKTPEEEDQILHDALHCDYYFMSTNAISMGGKLVNIDGRGNRIAALLYGPKKVIVIAGMNKVTSDEDEAVRRARRLAAPLNAIRLDKKTPCVSTGICQHCKQDDCICCHTLVTRMSKPKDRITVILVGEDLGY